MVGHYLAQVLGLVSDKILIFSRISGIFENVRYKLITNQGEKQAQKHSQQQQQETKEETYEWLLLHSEQGPVPMT